MQRKNNEYSNITDYLFLLFIFLFIVFIIFGVLNVLHAQQIRLPDLSAPVNNNNNDNNQQNLSKSVENKISNINPNQSEEVIRHQLSSVQLDEYPAAVDYYGQRIHIKVPYGVPIIVEMPDYIIDKTAEVAVSGLMVLPQGKEETSILRLLSTKNVNMSTELHVTLANGIIISLSLTLLQNDGTLDVSNIITRYKIIDHITENLKTQDSMEKIIDEPELVNFMADKIAYRQLLSLAGIYEYYETKKKQSILAEDSEKSIYIDKYNIANVSLVFRTDFRGKDRQIPVILFGLKTFYCNKDKYNFLTIDVDYVKQVFNSYYKISYKKDSDSVIPPDSCVPVYVILWEGINSR